MPAGVDYAEHHSGWVEDAPCEELDEDVHPEGRVLTERNRVLVGHGLEMDEKERGRGTYQWFCRDALSGWNVLIMVLMGRDLYNEEEAEDGGGGAGECR